MDYVAQRSVLCALFVKFFTNSAIASGIACLTPTDVDFRRLSHNDISTGVLASTVEMFPNNHPRSFHVFSATAPAPPLFSEYCLKYEIHNISDDEIINILWKVAGLRISRLAAAGNDGDMRTKVNREISVSPPSAIRAEIFAFRNEISTALAYVPVKPIAKVSESPNLVKPQMTWMPFEDLQKEERELISSFYTDSQTEQSLFPGISVTSETFGDLTISTSYAMGDQTISFFSSVEIDEEYLRLTNYVDADNLMNYSAIQSVFYDAMDNVAKNSVDQSAGVALLRLLKSGGDAGFHDAMRREVANGVMTSFISERQPNQKQFFGIARHPVTITLNGNTDCILVDSFSLIPLTQDLDDCPVQ